MDAEGVSRGTVRRTGGGVYVVALDDGRRVEASLRGRLKKKGGRDERVVIGDRVEVAGAETEHPTIESVAERRTVVVRRRPGGRRPKVVAANVDRMLAVVAATRPDPRLEVIDRLLVIAESGGVEPVVVVNKLDLPGAGETAARLASLYGEAGYTVVATSATDGRGMSELGELLCTGTSALVGPSGVGKSSLLNALEPTLELRIGELSRKVARGRHTTVSSRLIALSCGGLVADTPGFSDIGVWGVDAEELDRCFPEIRRLGSGCRFQDCAHLAEPGCAVLDAVEAGEIAPSRHASYRALREEAGELRPGG